MQHMDQRLREAERLIDAVISSTDVACVSAGDLRVLAERIDRISRKASGFSALVVGEIARKGAWNDGRSRSVEDWVARTTGAGWGEAKATVALGETLRALPSTTEALLEGRISATQAGLVARAASVDPHAEYRMLDLAGRASVKELKDAAQRVVASASGQTDEEQAAVHRTRFLRTWTGTDGAFHLQGRMTKADGAKVLAVLEPLMEIEFTNARRQGRRESPDAYRADALVALAGRGALGSGRRAAGSVEAPDEHATPAAAEGVEPRPTAHVIVRVDHAALLRGHVEGDETCEIEGIGPIPVAEAQRLVSLGRET